ncbi:MAG: hypothetical protein Q4G35_05955 [Propionibacteriaceae bacterium]|nr:hypothetical protein [Propionibacteriaceae bacterium]
MSGNPAECLEGSGERAGAVVRMETPDGVRDVYVRVDGCRNLGYDDGTTQRKLTNGCRLLFNADPVRLDAGSQEVFDKCWTEPN